MWALIKKSYRYLTIFLFSSDYSETQMVAFYQRSFGTQLKLKQKCHQRLGSTLPHLSHFAIHHSLHWLILNLIFLIEPKGLAKLANIAC